MAVAIESERVLSVSQAARVLGRSADRVRELVDSGRLPAIRTPLGRLLRASDVEAFAARQAE